MANSLTKVLTKLQGDHAALPAAFNSKAVLLAWLGAFIAIAAVALLSNQLSYLLILGLAPVASFYLPTQMRLLRNQET
jgi:hypothetical protein